MIFLANMIAQYFFIKYSINSYAVNIVHEISLRCSTRQYRVLSVSMKRTQLTSVNANTKLNTENILLLMQLKRKSMNHMLFRP
jgi:hypothetical protein